jgi:succinate-acetate transporter protein
MKTKQAPWQRDFALCVPLGLWVLGALTFIWSWQESTWISGTNGWSLMIAAAFFLGIATVLAGIGLFIVGDNFGFVLLSLFGFLWLANGTARLISLAGLFGIAVGDLQVQGIIVFYLLWTIVLVLFLPVGFGHGIALGILLTIVTVLSIFQTLSRWFEYNDWTGAATLFQISGYLGAVAGILTMIYAFLDLYRNHPKS